MPVASSSAWPLITEKPAGNALTASRTKAVLPEPASPSTKTTPGRRAIAASADAEMTANSWARATKSPTLSGRSDEATRAKVALGRESGLGLRDDEGASGVYWSTADGANFRSQLAHRSHVSPLLTP